MSNILKSNNNLHFELLMNMVFLRIYNDIDYLKELTKKLFDKISVPKKNIFNLDVIDQNNLKVLETELLVKQALLETFLKTLEKNNIEVSFVNPNSKIEKLFSNDLNGALKYSFLLQIIEFPIYASIEKKYSKENTKLKSFEMISEMLGYPKDFAFVTEKEILNTLAEISDLNFTKIILQTTIPLLALSLILPFSISLFAGTGLFGAAAFTSGLATIGAGTMAGGALFVSVFDILVGGAVVGARIGYEKQKNKKMVLLNEDIIRSEGTNLVLIYNYLNNMNDENSKTQRNNLVKDFLMSKNDYEESNILNELQEEKKIIVEKLKIANNISKKLIQLNK